MSLYGQMKIDYDLVRVALSYFERGEQMSKTLREEGVEAGKRLSYDKKDALAYEFNRKAPRSLKTRLGFNLDKILEDCTRINSSHTNIQ